jgi:NUDIX domain
MVSKLRYCPACGGTLEIQPAGHPASPQPVCQACGFVLWQNPKPSVQALILRGNGRNAEVLLGRRGTGPGKGYWSAPGGFLNLVDEPPPALIRECERELGVSACGQPGRVTQGRCPGASPHHPDYPGWRPGRWNSRSGSWRTSYYTLIILARVARGRAESHSYGGPNGLP